MEIFIKQSVEDLTCIVFLKNPICWAKKWVNYLTEIHVKLKVNKKYVVQNKITLNLGQSHQNW